MAMRPMKPASPMKKTVVDGPSCQSVGLFIHGHQKHAATTPALAASIEAPLSVPRPHDVLYAQMPAAQPTQSDLTDPSPHRGQASPSSPFGYAQPRPYWRWPDDPAACDVGDERGVTSFEVHPATLVAGGVGADGAVGELGASPFQPHLLRRGDCQRRSWSSLG